MAAETLRPDGQLSCSNLVTCDFPEHDDDPDISSVTINATSNNAGTKYGVNFPTPAGVPNVGAGLQEFRVGVEEFDSGQTGTPTARIELWENNVLVRAGPDINVSVYAVLSLTWDASELTTTDGSLVQCKLIGTKSGGSPSKRNSVRIGHIEWNADIGAAAPVTGDGFAVGNTAVIGNITMKVTGDGASTGTSTVIAVGQEAAATADTGDGLATGTSTVTGDANAIFAGAGLATGAATVTGDGVSTSSQPGTAVGISLAKDVGISLAKDVDVVVVGSPVIVT